MKTAPYLARAQPGHHHLVLESNIGYEAFAALAESWASRLNLVIFSKADGLDILVWEGTRNGKNFRLAWDHWLLELGLEPQNAEAEAELLAISRELGVKPDA